MVDNILFSIIMTNFYMKSEFYTASAVESVPLNLLFNFQYKMQTLSK